jgi:hypothetical protein
MFILNVLLPEGSIVARWTSTLAGKADIEGAILR